jgi:hypothetical protein
VFVGLGEKLKDSYTPKHLRNTQGLQDMNMTTTKRNPAGIDEGSIYAVLLTQGCTADQFHNIIGALTDAGKIRKEKGLLFA